MKQSSYDVVGELHIHSIIIGPYGSGSTVLLHNMILEPYKESFERIFMFSLYIDVDSSWLLANKHIEKEMKVQRIEEEPIYFDHYDLDALHDILDTQHNITQFMKNRGDTKCFRY